jgi:hypothetical protein
MMNKPFEFAEFVDEFKVPFTAIQSEDVQWQDNGDPIPGDKPPVQMEGIILPLTENDLKYSEAGTYSVKDKKIYTTQPLELGQVIEYKGDPYTIQSFKDYSDYADVYIYLARYRGK